MRFQLAMLAAFSSVVALAQNPNVLVKLDTSMSLRGGNGSGTQFYGYDPLGRHSVVTLQFNLEPGFDVVLSQRFQVIERDRDKEQLDEYYIEDKGLWRLGKQYLPFGRGVVRDAVYAASLQTTFGSQAYPVQVAYVDGGPNVAKGVTGRIGGRTGVSASFGERFWGNGASLTTIRRAEESPGRRRGYRTAYGLDTSFEVSKNLLAIFEHVSLSDGEASNDESLEVSDLRLTYASGQKRSLTVGITFEGRSQSSLVRLHGQYPVYEGFEIEPFLRWKNGRFHEAAVTLRFRP